MSGDLSAEPDISARESIVNIYVSAESLKVYDNPWVENTSPNPSGLEIQHSVINETSGRRNLFRTYSVLLGVICLLLLAGIIFLGVKLKEDKRERDEGDLGRMNTELERIADELKSNNTELGRIAEELKSNNTELERIADELKSNNTELSDEKNKLWNKFCTKDPKLCQNLDDDDS